MRWGSALRTGIGALALMAAAAMPSRAQAQQVADSFPVVAVYQDNDLSDDNPGVRLGSFSLPDAGSDRRALFAGLLQGGASQTLFTYDQQGERTGNAVLHLPEGYYPEIGMFDPSGANYVLLAARYGGPLLTSLGDDRYALDIHGTLDLEQFASGQQSMCLPLSVVSRDDPYHRLDGYVSISRPSVQRWIDDEGKEHEQRAPPPVDCPQEYRSVERPVEPEPPRTVVTPVPPYVPPRVMPLTAVGLGMGYKMGKHDQWTADCATCIDFDGPALAIDGAYLSDALFARGDLLGMMGDGESLDGESHFDVTVLNGRAIVAGGSGLAFGGTVGGLSFSADGVEDVDFSGGYFGVTVGKRLGSSRSTVMPSIGVGGVSAGDASGLALIVGVDAITDGFRGGVGGAVFRENGYTNALMLGRASIPIIGSLELFGDAAWAPICYDDFSGDDHLQGAIGLQYRF